MLSAIHWAHTPHEVCLGIREIERERDGAIQEWGMFSPLVRQLFGIMVKSGIFNRLDIPSFTLIPKTGLPRAQSFPIFVEYPRCYHNSENRHTAGGNLAHFCIVPNLRILRFIA